MHLQLSLGSGWPPEIQFPAAEQFFSAADQK